ncbi:MAG: PQQ-binding-like beta-propeller repeat protein [Planctomycetota bacterium]|nr:PQQ-binding-like beta-propeller repeat protein [Planctomycetota bacterium]
MYSSPLKFATVLKLSLMAVVVLSSQQPVKAQNTRLAVNPANAKRLGMEVMWRTQLETGPTAKLQNIAQVFGKTKKLVKFVVTFQDVREEFYEDDVDRFGRKIGVAGAKARAEAKLKRYQTIGFDTAKLERIVEDPEVLAKAYTDKLQQYQSAQGFAKGKLENQLRGIESRRKRLLADITFLAQSSTCLIQSIDGRTGKTNWTQQIGKRNHPSMPVIAKRNHFAVVNASDVYCGSLENGRVVWQRECRGAPGSRAAMTRNSIFVPMVDGFVEQFVIRDGNAPTGDILSIGHSLLGATSSDSVVAWPSDRGELNVAFDSLELKEVSYRLVPKKEITSNAAFSDPYLFATSTDGSLYCLKESNGKMIWEIPTGIPISRSPFAVGKFVYFIDDNHQLNQVIIESGIPTWSKNGIEKVVCASAKRVYCLNQQNHLIAIDLMTGNYIGSLTTRPTEFVYQNTMTDRLLVGTDQGLIQCLREVDQVEPIFYRKPEVAAASKATTGKTPVQQPQAKPKPNNNDPFGGGGDDPFGGGAKKGGDDPFGGGGDDPFGGGAKKGDDDPFGGGDAKNGDPFGN